MAEYVLSNVLFIVTVLGFVICVPSALLALSEKRWFIVAIDFAALIWMATIWRKHPLPFFLRSWGFLFAFPAMAALLLGLRVGVVCLGAERSHIAHRQLSRQYMQGFLFDRPMSVDEWLTQNNG